MGSVVHFAVPYVNISFQTNLIDLDCEAARDEQRRQATMMNVSNELAIGAQTIEMTARNASESTIEQAEEA